jgi:flagellar export protein FliJ
VSAFSFRLDKVLRYRAYLERRVRLQLCEAVTRMKEQEGLVRLLGAQRAAAAKDLAEARSRGMTGHRDQIHASFLRHLTESVTEAKGELEKRRERLELLKTLLVLATRKKKSLESLKEAQFGRFTEAAAKREQKLLDELVVIRRERVDL